MPKKIKQIGGDNVISASNDLIQSMIALGKSIFVEIDSITHMSSQLNNGTSTTNAPNSQQSPPPFNAPALQ
jgi:hypothetical protein